MLTVWTEMWPLSQNRNEFDSALYHFCPDRALRYPSGSIWLEIVSQSLRVSLMFLHAQSQILLKFDDNCRAQ